MMKLSDLQPAKGATKSRKRVGRGTGSGHGKTSGKGHKGQKARSGGKVRGGFEGGQMPLQRRLPKVGFTNIFKKVYAIVNVSDLERFDSGAVVDAASLKQVGLIKNVTDIVKLLGNGEINRPLTINVKKYSKTAAKKVEAAGGKIQEI